jgi:Domain of unknown function (DUF4926)
MSAIKENDVIRLRRSVEARIMGDSGKAFFPSGSLGAVVGVFGSPEKPDGYAIEFVVKPGESYAVAQVEADAVMVEWRAPRE